MIKKSIKKIQEKYKKQKTILISFSFFLIFILIVCWYVKTNDNNENSENYQENQEIEFYQSLFPARNWEKDSLNIEARSALVAYFVPGEKEKFIFEKNKNLEVPIASIAKLMTALIVLENYDLNEIIIVTEEAFNKDPLRVNSLYIKEEYQVKDLLYPLLMESNNIAAYVLAEKTRSLDNSHQKSISFFIESMNQKAYSLGMNNTFFVNPSGLDSSNPGTATNYSTAEDLVILIKNLLEKPLIWEILLIPEYDLIRQDGFFKYTINNTNLLLEEIPEIIGGKTGTTTRAGQCFVSVIRKNEGYLITVILGSRDRFVETKKMIDWVNEAYHWEM